MNSSTLIRNSNGGRSTSQISIYDYPEHLNPFYEDENHKRLRFWNIGKKSGKENRRGSFSLDGLKEMWAFKSFRLKKKSSTLGINKTSESPPPLRRYLDPSETNYGTYDPRMRHTAGLSTLNNNFQRNVPYRSSLQDMRTTQTLDRSNGGIGFTRNDRYRSTMQPPGYHDDTSRLSPPMAPPRRYVYGGSVTPQPRNRYNDYNTIGSYENYRGISRGSSQTSVASTNPFDEDEDDVVVRKFDSDAEKIEGKPTPVKRPARKKRRAPPPPVPIPKQIDEEPASSPATPSTSQFNQSDDKENVNIANLTAEIENFVKTTTENEEIETRKTPTDANVSITITVTEASPTVEQKSLETMHANDVITKAEICNIEKVESNESQINIVENNDEIKNSYKEDKNIVKNNDERKNSYKENNILVNNDESMNSYKEHNTVVVNKSKLQDSLEENNVIVVNRDDRQSSYKGDKIVVESNGDKQNSRKESNIIEVNGDGRKSSLKESNNILVKNMSPKKPEVDAKYTISQTEETNSGNAYGIRETSEVKFEDFPESVVELRITESKEDISEKSEISNESSDKYQIRYVPLKDSLSDISETQTQISKKLEDSNGSVPHEKRRSVKEIIESINRSQSLLKINQDQIINSQSQQVNNLNEPDIRPPPRKSFLYKEKLNKNYKDLASSQREIKRMTYEMDNVTNNHSSNEFKEIFDKLNEEPNNNNKNISNNNNNYNNNDIFKKCVTRKEINRESSPTASNLDWNPLPKPKRTKNLTELNTTVYQ